MPPLGSGLVLGLLWQHRPPGMPPAVLLVGNFLSGYGRSPNVGAELARRLRTSGWRVLTTSSRQHPLSRMLDMVRGVWAHRGQYRVAQVDVFSGPAFVWAEVVCAELRTLSTPYVLTLHGGNLPTFGRRWPRRVRHLLSSAAAVTTPSRFLYDEMRPYRPHLRLIPNGLELAIYQFRPRARVQPRMVWLRAFHQVYNPTLAPAVLAQVQTEFADAHLTMIGPDMGDGALADTMRAARRLGVTSSVALPGPIPKAQVPSWLDKGDIFLNTSTIDNAPVSVVEAMASGLCVVSTEVGGLPALLQHEGEALLVPSDNPEAMAEAVCRLLRDSALAERLSAAARRKAESFDWAAVLPEWERLLTAVSQGWRE